ncbi:hypothetical protein C9925_00770, partial [cyanobacterium G8-9]
MLKQRKLQLIIIILPLLILLAIAGYFINISWEKYQVNKTVKTTLENARLLQKYEEAVLNETLCMTLVKKELKSNSEICKDRIKESNLLLNEIMKKDDNLHSWKHEIERIKENSQKYTLDNIEEFIGRKNIESTVKSYLNKLKYERNLLNENELLDTYIRISDAIYATQLENFLVTYYVSTNVPVSVLNTIFWDKVVEASSLFNLYDNSNISSIK